MNVASRRFDASRILSIGVVLHTDVSVVSVVRDERAGTVVDAIGDRANVILVAASMAGITAPIVCTRRRVDLLVRAQRDDPHARRDLQRVGDEHGLRSGEARVPRQPWALIGSRFSVRAMPGVERRDRLALERLMLTPAEAP